MRSLDEILDDIKENPKPLDQALEQEEQLVAAAEASAAQPLLGQAPQFDPRTAALQSANAPAQ